MKNGGGHFAPKLGGHFELESGGHFELESGGHFKLELGGQYHWNLHHITYFVAFYQILPFLGGRFLFFGFVGIFQLTQF